MGFLAGPNLDFAPHDILRIDDKGLHFPVNTPEWVVPSLKKHPWAVVRRAVTEDPAKLAIGIRGAHRSQRFATEINLSLISEKVTPEELTARILTDMQSSPLSAVAVLPQLSAHLIGRAWGPGGSVGYMLATGADCVSKTSDLDLILRVEMLPPHALAVTLHASIKALALHSDVLLELPTGGVVLDEYAASPASFILRTRNGPRLMQVPV